MHANTAHSLSAAKILVVDDDEALRDLLTDYLSRNGLSVTAVGDGAEMREALKQGSPDAIVLDLMLPGEDGLALTRFVRAQSSIPILMLSARGEEIDRVVGLEVGADDYMPKPFGPRELLARLRALLRRSQSGNPSAHTDTTDTRHFGPFVLDTAGRRLMRNETEVHLTGAEFDLLVIFVEKPNRVLSRDTLVDLLKGYDRDPFDRSIDIRVTRLRRKIEDDASSPCYIRTVRGEGYLFNPRGKEQ